MGKISGASDPHRTAQPPALASFRTWGIQRELVVRDLPRRKGRRMKIGMVVRVKNREGVMVDQWNR